MTQSQSVCPDPSVLRILITAGTLLAVVAIFLGGAYVVAPSLMRLKAQLGNGGVSVEMEVRQEPPMVPSPQEAPASSSRTSSASPTSTDSPATRAVT